MGHLFQHEWERLDAQDWASRLGVPPYVRVGRNRVLNKRPDGSCVFLTDDNLCLIHKNYGEDAKPLACRIFPFSVRPVAGGWQASLRFDCPSVTSSKGRPIGQHRAMLEALAGQLDHDGTTGQEELKLRRGLRATVEETQYLMARLVRWLRRDELVPLQRLTGAARLTHTLSEATLHAVRGKRFAELLDLLIGELPGTAQDECPTPTRRQRGMVRQAAFAHAEHVALADMRAGIFSRMGRRLHQLAAARHFLAGRGQVPPLPGFAGGVSFAEVESVSAARDDVNAIEHLLIRYVLARIQGCSVFGAGYYGWPVLAGLNALWCSVAVVGWLARLYTAGEGRTVLTAEDVSRAVGVVDRAATRAPSVGGPAERARTAYLAGSDGVAGLVCAYWPTETQ